MRPLVFARYSPRCDHYSIEALYSHDLAGIEERLRRDGIGYTMSTGRVGENFITIPVDQQDVDKDIWARTLVDDCNFIDLPDDLDLSPLKATIQGDLYDYAKRSDRPRWITFREYAGIHRLYYALESATSRWGERPPVSYLFDLLDHEIAKHPRIAFRAFLRLYDFLQNGI